MADIYGIGAGLMGGIMNFFQSGLNTEAAKELAAIDRLENYKYGEMSADNADMRTRRLYENYYSPAALLKQYAQAGLSPSMMFGGTPGQGGTTGAQGHGAMGLQTAYAPVSMVEAAQSAALLAQAEKTKAETKTIEGDTPRGWAEIANIMADTLNKEAQTKLTDAEASWQKLQNYIGESTKDASMYQIAALAEKAGYEAKTAFEILQQNQVKTQVSKETVSEQIQLRKKEVEALAQSITESKSLVNLNEEKKRQVHNEILQAWEQIDINWKAIEIDQQHADTYTKWIDEQIPIIEKQLEIRLKELGLEQTRVIVDAVTGTIKSIAFGAMATAQFKGGAGGNATPPGAKSVLKPKTSSYKPGIPKHKQYYGMWDE